MPKRKASFYGVRVGNKPGVYDDWEVCKLQVLGFPGSQYKGFPTRIEAEKYVEGFMADDRNIAVSRTPSTQYEANTDANKRCKQDPLPIATTKSSIIEPSLQKARISKKEITSPSHPMTRVQSTKEEVISPSDPMTRVTTIKEEVITPSDPLAKFTMSREEVTAPAQLLTRDSSNYYKVVEENGQRFVVFDSIKKFDSYFEVLCRTRHLGRSVSLKTSCGNQEIRSQEQTSDTSQELETQGKVTEEDDEFVYFKDEDELRRFLEPYFKNAKHNSPGPSQAYQSVVAVSQAASYTQPGIYLIEFDGASKGNPGQAGAGALIRCPHGSVVLEMTEPLGRETNNVAEYRALILGLKTALSKGIQKVRAQGDSKLVCLQVTGAWKVENKNIVPLHKEVERLKGLFEEFSIAHIRREYNSAADALANEAVYLGEAARAREVAKVIPECCL